MTWNLVSLRSERLTSLNQWHSEWKLAELYEATIYNMLTEEVRERVTRELHVCAFCRSCGILPASVFLDSWRWWWWWCWWWGRRNQFKLPGKLGGTLCWGTCNSQDVLNVMQGYGVYGGQGCICVSVLMLAYFAAYHENYFCKDILVTLVVVVTHFHLRPNSASFP